MATFLELCQDVARESGTLAGGVNLPSVTGVTGRADKIVSWVRKAWLNIQTDRVDWIWMRREFTAPLIAGASRYLPASLNLTRVGSWETDRPWYRPFSLYDPAIGLGDEAPIDQITYDLWRNRYGRGAQTPMRPNEYAISPMGELCFGSVPDKAYILCGEYVLAPQILTNNNDTPEMPPQYHPAIVWEALRLLANADEAPQSIVTATNDYAMVRMRMDRDLLPKVGMVIEPLA